MTSPVDLRVFCILLVCLSSAWVQGFSPARVESQLSPDTSDLSEGHDKVNKREVAEISQQEEEADLYPRHLVKRQSGYDYGGSLDYNNGAYNGRVDSSYTWDRDDGSTTLNGYGTYNSRYGLGGGVGLSNTWRHDSGASTTLRGGVDFHQGRDPGWGIGLRHRFKRDLEAAARHKRQSGGTVDGGIEDRDETLSARLRGSYTQNREGGSTTVNGYGTYNSERGVGAGAGFTNTWRHDSGRSTTLGGGVDLHQGRDPVAHGRVGHSYTQDRDDGSTTVNGYGTFNSERGLGAGFDASRTWRHDSGASTTVEGGVDLHQGRDPVFNSRVGHSYTQDRDDGSAAVNGYGTFNSESGLGGGFDFSRTWRHDSGASTSLRGGADFQQGRDPVVHGRAAGSYRWDHGGGSSTALDGYGAYHSRDGASGGLGLSRTWENDNSFLRLRGGVDLHQHRDPSWNIGLGVGFRFKRDLEAAVRHKRETERNTVGESGLSREKRERSRFSRTWNHTDGSSSTFDGYVDHDAMEGGFHGSHTWNHGGRGSTTLRGGADFGQGRAPNWSIGFRHTYRFRRDLEAALHRRELEAALHRREFELAERQAILEDMVDQGLLPHGVYV